jgi:hypothetical protein
MTNVLIKMPYLHWANLETHKSSRGENLAPTLRHPRRSLDQATDRCYTIKNLEKRDGDQVVTRCLKNRNVPVPEWTLMVIDQLWLWILDEGT